MFLFNTVLIIILIVIAVIAIYIVFHSKEPYEHYELTQDEFSISYLADQVQKEINHILRTNILELNLNRYETEKREENKSKLSASIRSCSHGDMAAKEYLKGYIKDILMRKFKITEENIDNVIPFYDSKLLNETEKFEILLHKLYKTHKADAFVYLMEKYKLDQLTKNEEGEEVFDVVKGRMTEIYEAENVTLEFADKLDIITQFIYAPKFGNSVIDTLLDMKIDGVSGGVSGIPYGFYTYQDEILFSGDSITYSFESVWTFLKGKTIHLSFLSFGCQEELERVCKNIYNNGNVGQLTEMEGYKVADLKDGSRVTVSRPSFCESWCFLVRKHQNFKISSLPEIITKQGCEKVITFIKAAVKGKQIIAVTGSMGSGKTALLRAILKILPAIGTLRIHEHVFELGMRKQLKNRNIITFRDIESIKTQDALNMIKTTDGNYTVIGEVATAEQTAYVIQKAKTASDQTMFSSHPETTQALITGMRNDLLKVGGFNNEKIAEEQVVSVLDLDIHMLHNRFTGERWVDRITEIVPVGKTPYPSAMKEAMIEFFRRMTDRETYNAVDVIVLENDSYVVKNNLSPERKNRIASLLDGTEKEDFLNLFKGVEGGEQSV